MSMYIHHHKVKNTILNIKLDFPLHSYKKPLYDWIEFKPTRWFYVKLFVLYIIWKKILRVYGVYVVYPIGTPLDDKRGGDGAFASAAGANNQSRVYHLSHLWSCSVVGQQNRRRTIFGWRVGSLLRFTRTTIATRRCYFDI